LLDEMDDLENPAARYGLAASLLYSGKFYNLLLQTCDRQILVFPIPPESMRMTITVFLLLICNQN
jgi:hypothetical protein